MRNNIKHKLCKNVMNKDLGFSLVEVLVCIAVIAIICVPLFSGIRFSAVLNSKANYTQKVTAYAQEELEIIKSMPVETYLADFKAGRSDADGLKYTYVESGDEWNALNSRAKAIEDQFITQYEGSLTKEELKALFSPFICEKDHINIGGKKYKMYVKFMPAEYSQYDKTTAANVNVAGYYDVAEPDAVKYAVISDEINKYDMSCISSIQERLHLLGETSKTDLDIMGDMKKTITVDIVSPTLAGGDEMSVSCDVVYSFPADSPVVELNYNVYNSTYTLDPATGNDIGSKSGGRVFLFARAFQNKNKNKCINDLIVKSKGNTDVYFVLGSDSSGGSDKSIYNFSTVTLQNGQDGPSSNYISDYSLNIGLNNIPGQMDIPGTNGVFYCNIKSSGQVLNNSEDYDTIGGKDYKAISYAVEIEMYEETEENTRVAHLEATIVD